MTPNIWRTGLIKTSSMYSCFRFVTTWQGLDPTFTVNLTFQHSLEIENEPTARWLLLLLEDIQVAFEVNGPSGALREMILSTISLDPRLDGFDYNATASGWKWSWLTSYSNAKQLSGLAPPFLQSSKYVCFPDKPIKCIQCCLISYLSLMR